MSVSMAMSERHGDEERMATWKGDSGPESDMSSPIAQTKSSPLARDHLPLNEDWIPSARVGTSPSARIHSGHTSPAARASNQGSPNPRLREHTSPRMSEHGSPPPAFAGSHLHSRHSYESSSHHLRHCYRPSNGDSTNASPVAAVQGIPYDDSGRSEGAVDSDRILQHMNGFNYSESEFARNSLENGKSSSRHAESFPHQDSYPAPISSVEDVDREGEHGSPVKHTIRFPIMTKKSPTKKLPSGTPNSKGSYDEDVLASLPSSWAASGTECSPDYKLRPAVAPESTHKKHRGWNNLQYLDADRSKKSSVPNVDVRVKTSDRAASLNGEQQRGWIKAPGRPGEGTVLKCQYCPFTKPVGTGCMVAIRKHEACHFNKSTYRCHVCTFSTININTFRQHQQMHVDHGDCSLESLEISGPRKRKARKTIPSASLPKPKRPPISSEIKELIKRDIYNQHQASIANPGPTHMSPHHMSLLDKYKRASLMSLMYNDCGSPERSQNESIKRPKLDDCEASGKYYETAEQAINNADMAERQRYWRRAELAYSQEKYYADNSNFIEMFKTPHQLARKSRYSGYDSEAAGSAYMSGDESRASSYGRQSGDEAYDMSSRYTPSPYRDSPAPYMMPTASPEGYPVDNYREDVRYRRPRAEDYDHLHGDEFANRMNMHRGSPFLYNAPGDMSSARSSPSVRSSPPNMVYDMRTVTPVPSISPASSYDDQVVLDLTPRHHHPTMYAEAEMYYGNEECLDLSVGKAPSTSDTSIDDASESDGVIDLSAKPTASATEQCSKIEHERILFSESEKKRRMVMSRIDEVISRNNQLVTQTAERTARTQPKGHHIPHIPADLSPACLIDKDSAASSPEDVSRFHTNLDGTKEMPVLEKATDVPLRHLDESTRSMDEKEFLFVGEESEKHYDKNGFLNVVYKCKFCPFTSGGALSSKAVVSKHEKCHVTQRRYACDLCNYNTDCSKNMRAHLSLHPVGSAKILMNGMPAVLRMRKKRFSAALVDSCEGDVRDDDDTEEDTEKQPSLSPHANIISHESLSRLSNGYVNESMHLSPHACPISGDSLARETAKDPQLYAEIVNSPVEDDNERTITKKRTKHSQSQGAVLREKYKAPPGEKSVLKCPLCPQRTTTKSPAAAYNMKRHELCHTVAGRFTCSLCSYSSQYLEHLKRHQNLHSIYDGCTPPIKQGKKFIDIAKRKKKAIAVLGGENTVSIDRSKRDKSDILKIKFKFGAKAVTTSVDESNPESEEAVENSGEVPESDNPRGSQSPIPLPIYEDITPVATPPRSPLKQPIVPQDLPPDLLTDEFPTIESADETPLKPNLPPPTSITEGSDSSNATIEMGPSDLDQVNCETQEDEPKEISKSQSTPSDEAAEATEKPTDSVEPTNESKEVDKSQAGNTKGVKVRAPGEKYRIKCRYCPFTTAGNAAAKLTMERHEGAHFMRGSYTCDICSFSSFQFWKMKRHKRLHGVDMDGKAVAMPPDQNTENMETMDTIETLEVHHRRLKETIAASKKSKASNRHPISKSEENETTVSETTVPQDTETENVSTKECTSIEKGDENKTCNEIPEIDTDKTDASDWDTKSDIKNVPIKTEPNELKPKGMIFRPLRPPTKPKINEVAPKKFRLDCKYCPFKVNSQSNASKHHLLLHEQCHFKKSPFTCDHCTYSGKSPCSLKKHLIVHNADYTAGQHCRTLPKHSARLRKVPATGELNEIDCNSDPLSDEPLDVVKEEADKGEITPEVATTKEELPVEQAPPVVRDTRNDSESISNIPGAEEPQDEISEKGNEVGKVIDDNDVESRDDEEREECTSKEDAHTESSLDENVSSPMAQENSTDIETTLKTSAKHDKISDLSEKSGETSENSDNLKVTETNSAVTEDTANVPEGSTSPDVTTDVVGETRDHVEESVTKSLVKTSDSSGNSIRRQKVTSNKRKKSIENLDTIPNAIPAPAAEDRVEPCPVAKLETATVVPKKKAKSATKGASKKGGRRWTAKKTALLTAAGKKETTLNIPKKEMDTADPASGSTAAHGCKECAFVAEVSEALERHINAEHTKKLINSLADDIYSFPDTPTMCDSPVSPGGYLHKHSATSKSKTGADTARDGDIVAKAHAGHDSLATTSESGAPELPKSVIPTKTTARATLSKRKVQKSPSARMKKGIGSMPSSSQMMAQQTSASATIVKKSPKSKPFQTDSDAVQIGISALVAAGPSAPGVEATVAGKKKPDKKMLEIPAELWWDPNQSLFQCQWCDFTSTRVHYFKIHLYCHQRKRAKHRCARCGYGATRPAFLAEHHRQHHKSLINVTNNDQPKDLYEAVKERLKEKGIDERVIEDLTGPKPNQAFSPLLLKEREKAPSPPPEPATKTKIIKGMTPMKKGSLKSKRKWESAVPKQHAILPEESPKFLCRHCPFTTTSTEVESSHRAKHSKRNRHSCPYCTYATRTRVYLEKHVKLHFTEPLQKSALENLPLNLDALKEKKGKRTTKQQTGSSTCRYCDVKVELTRLTSHEEKHLIGCGYLRFTNGATSTS